MAPEELVDVEVAVRPVHAEREAIVVRDDAAEPVAGRVPAARAGLVRVAAAALLVSTDYPRRGRGVAAICRRKIRAANVRQRRDRVAEVRRDAHGL